ncbi:MULTISPECIES: PF20097 family protein [Anaerotignum]|uniref:PF20097 family protein n=1 Tax=Anaerotignum TaxID=2039240 RepID=UPI00210D8E38|nr:MULTISPECIES: PF20097 family protein [Anaerotignum]MCQ4935586.1 PF20097 family protein [Anaerotignum propionicum]
MKCPFCQEEMSQGHLESGRYFTWKTKDENGKKQEYLLVKSYMGGAKLSGEICPYCRKLILDIPENQI